MREGLSLHPVVLLFSVFLGVPALQNLHYSLYREATVRDLRRRTTPIFTDPGLRIRSCTPCADLLLRGHSRLCWPGPTDNLPGRHLMGVAVPTMLSCLSLRLPVVGLPSWSLYSPDGLLNQLLLWPGWIR